jgi:hypothetical protein
LVYHASDCKIIQIKTSVIPMTRRRCFRNFFEKRNRKKSIRRFI